MLIEPGAKDANQEKVVRVKDYENKQTFIASTELASPNWARYWTNMLPSAYIILSH